MQPANYCREAIQHLEYNARTNKDAKVREDCAQAASVLRDAVKFMVPSTGRALNDPELRALDINGEIRLPFKTIAIEYAPGDNGERRISVAKEMPISAGGPSELFISTWFVIRMDAQSAWMSTPVVFLPITNFVEVLSDGALYPKAFHIAEMPDELALEAPIAVLSLLNALACSNVKIEAIPPRKPRKKARSAIPFDTYHILTLDPPRGADRVAGGGSHRSPREHLRRGHIRRLDDGRRIWVNATVVNAGVGGKIAKDYRIR